MANLACEGTTKEWNESPDFVLQRSRIIDTKLNGEAVR
jgi:hypothetical protein